MQNKQIQKRNGQTENFDPNKIKNSISQSIVSAGLKDNPLSDKLFKQAIEYLKTNSIAEEKITTDDIRSAINIVLLENDLPQIAKIYFKMRGKKISNKEQIFSGIKEIKKRDGSVVAFDRNKVTHALLKAGQASEEFNQDEARRLSDVVVAILEHKFSEHLVPTVEQIQDIIEIILIQSNWAKTA